MVGMSSSYCHMQASLQLLNAVYCPWQLQWQSCREYQLELLLPREQPLPLTVAQNL